MKWIPCIIEKLPGRKCRDGMDEPDFNQLIADKMRLNMVMGFRKRFLLMLASIALVMPTSANTFAGEKDIVILGTATPGGGFPVYGDAFPGLLHQNLSWSL